MCLAKDIYGRSINKGDYIIAVKDGKLGMHRVLGETGNNNCKLECQPIIKSNSVYSDIHGHQGNMSAIDKLSEMILCQLPQEFKLYEDNTDWSMDGVVTSSPIG